MSRLKRIAISTALTLTVLGGATMLWYQSHYAGPLTPAPERKLPSPNGFDTLRQALSAQVGPVRWMPPQVPYTESLAERQKLLAKNERFLALTRDVLTQEFLAPDSYDSYIDSYSDRYIAHQGQLWFLAQTYADSGNFPQALRCALDMVELGVTVPRGGRSAARKAGYEYTKYGRQLVWQVIQRVDAKTARGAALRLEQLERKRWPLAETLREDLRSINNFQFRDFEDGPIALWETLTVNRDTGRTPSSNQELWERFKTVYGGPKGLEDEVAVWVQGAEKRADQLWHPNRPMLDPHTPRSENTYLASDYRDLEVSEYYDRTNCALLRTYLALHAYKLEKGGYPTGLRALVAERYLHGIPTDPFSSTRAPLRYQKNSDGTMALWSVGPDANDDNGTPLQGFTWRDKQQGYLPGDFVAKLTTLPQFWKNDRE